MDAVKFLKEWKRMCKSCSEDCANCSNECGFMKEFSGKRYDDLECWRCALLFPERSVKAVSEWAKAHPQKTRAQDFKERYPNAPLDESEGLPLTCAAYLGYTPLNCECGSDCEQCWNQPVE